MSSVTQYLPYLSRVPVICLLVFLAIWVYTAISPANRVQWSMESVLPAVLIGSLAFTYKQHPLSNLSYILLFIFLCMHIYAAYHTYSGTPFDDWLKKQFHTERSYYDRVVHFAFGLLLVIPAREYFTQVAFRSSWWSFVLTVFILLGLSALFEVIEWLVSVIAGSSGKEYMGLQGDQLDPLKDMGLAFAGAVVGAILDAYLVDLWRN